MYIPNIRINHNAAVMLYRELMQYLSPPFAPLWGAAGDHFIVPRTPFRMARYAIHIGPSTKAGLCSICYGLRFIGGEPKLFLKVRF
jgi:hypothetical protein